ncbi:hypothetical protein S245_054823, partial [Arachis hypogaea]
MFIEKKRSHNLTKELLNFPVIIAVLQNGIRKFTITFSLDTCKSLVRIFFAQRGTTKVPGITDRGLVLRKVKKVAIIGGELMGSGIQAAKSSRKPSVAAIDGLALGGVLEVAMVANFCNDEDDESFWSRWIKPDAIVQVE